MSVELKPIAAFVLSLMGGIFILLGAVVMSMFTSGAMNMMTGTMMNVHGGMGMTVMMGFAPILAIVGIASGIMVILGSMMLYNRPAESQLWGAIILAFSVVSLLGGLGGLLVGFILGLVGGILALTWKPSVQRVTA